LEESRTRGNKNRKNMEQDDKKNSEARIRRTRGNEN
jgi:hypothetical protein